MTFIDRKQDVLDIQLTPYAKLLLAQGRLKPSYYSFDDSDVLYDATFAAQTDEVQNAVDPRIHETPRVHQQPSYAGAETCITRNIKSIREQASGEASFFDKLGSGLQPLPDHHFATSAPLGTCSPESNSAPAWSVNALFGALSGSITYQGGEQPTLRIPQINLEPITYRTNVEQGTSLSQDQDVINEGDQEVGAFSDLNLLIQKFQDGSYLNITEDSALVEIEEANTLFEKDQFSIEVYLQETDASGEKILTPLSFVKPFSLMKGNILLDESDVPRRDVDIDESFVEFYFDVFCDNEIDEDTLCSVDNKEECEPRQQKRNIYKSSLTENDINGKC